MKRKYILHIYLVIFAFTLSCSKEKYVEPINSDNAPAPVTGISAKALAGGATITYKLPADPNLRYVKALYTVNGQQREAIASQYTNTLTVLGFPDTLEHEVKLYSVSKGEQMSKEPAIVKIKPLLPPLMEAYNSLQVKPTFGGISLTMQNSSQASLAVMILTPDSTNKLSVLETYYMSSANGLYAVRGFDSIPTPFSFVVRDRWGNLSDTLSGTYKPIYETQIPKNKFAALNLPTDTYAPHLVLGATYTMDKIWDGKTGNSPGLPIFHTAPSAEPMPKWFTFDMGVKVLFSRFKLFHRQPGDVHAYKAGDPKHYEIWGSATAPNSNGSWDGWTKIMDCHSYKPSGEANPNVTSEDINFACIQGEDFTFPEDIPPVRYLRIKIIETWGGTSFFFIDEMSFWGNIIQ